MATASPINTALNALKTALRAAVRAGTIKDGNIPFRNVWDTLDWDNASTNHLPLIQFGEIPGGDGEYLGDGMETQPLGLRLIVWVATNQDRAAAERRGRDAREQVIRVIHDGRVFSPAGAARQAIRIERESDTYSQKFAVGLGAMYRGELLLPAGGA